MRINKRRNCCHDREIICFDSSSFLLKSPVNGIFSVTFPDLIQSFVQIFLFLGLGFLKIKKRKLHGSVWIREFSGADTEKTDGFPVPQRVKEVKGSTADHIRGLGGGIELHLVRDFFKAAVFDLHADSRSKFLVGPQPSGYFFSKRAENFSGFLPICDIRREGDRVAHAL